LPFEENPEELKVHREFIEEEIEALRRLSDDGDELPPVRNFSRPNQPASNEW